jgi:hypothetical protein
MNNYRKRKKRKKGDGEGRMIKDTIFKSGKW